MLFKHIFLSHLCDGEERVASVDNCEHFLSHLCDGEGASNKTFLLSAFLSHLCDGEVMACCLSTLENDLALAPNKRVPVIKLFLFNNVSQFTAVTLAKRDTMTKLSKAHNIGRWIYQVRDFIKLLNNNYTKSVGDIRRNIKT